MKFAATSACDSISTIGHACARTSAHARTHLFMSVLMVKSALSMQMTFIMQMHANQTQPSENQGWEKIYTEILNERDKQWRINPFRWQEATNRSKHFCGGTTVSRRAQKWLIWTFKNAFFMSALILCASSVVLSNLKHKPQKHI